MTITEILNQTESITNIDEAKQYLTNLYMKGYCYHPDDPAADVDWGPKNPTAEEMAKMDRLMSEIFALCDDNFTNFDPYGYIIDLNPSEEND